jgi:hypothetical protein
LQLLMAARPRRHSGADRVAIGFRPNQHDQDPITVFETCLTLGIFGTFGRIPMSKKMLDNYVLLGVNERYLRRAAKRLAS